MTKRHLYLVAVLFAALFLLLTERCRAEDRDRASQIVSEVLKVYGGSEAIGKISSVIAKGRIEDYLTGTGGAYARYLERPCRLRIEVMPELGGEVRILNGDRGWQGRRNAFEKSSPVMVESMVYQYSYLDLPTGFADKTYPVAYGGKRKVGQREAYLLLVQLRGAPQLKVFIDVSTHLIVRVAADFAMGMMGANELATEYNDYHPVSGVLFPYRLVNYAGSTKLSEITLSDIRINQKIPGSLFTLGALPDSMSKK